MRKQLVLSILLGGMLTGSAYPEEVLRHALVTNGDAGIHNSYITSTGETVPNPGVSQSGGTTLLDLGIQKEDDEIDGSICKGC